MFFLGIVADFKCCGLDGHDYYSDFLHFLSKTLGTVPSAATIIGITVSFMF